MPYDTCRGGGCACWEGFRPSREPRPGFRPPSRRSTTVPPDALRRRSVRRLASSRPSPRTARASFRTPRPSCRSSRRFDRFSGKRSDAGGFRALISARIRSVHRSACGRIRGRSVRRCLHEVVPPRAFSPGVLASRFGRARSPFTFESFDVSTGSCHRVLRIAGVGSPLSGPPARPGSFTLRPSRIRSDRGWGLTHGFVSRIARVASGTIHDEPPRVRSGRGRASTRTRRPSVNGCC